MKERIEMLKREQKNIVYNWVFSHICMQRYQTTELTLSDISGFKFLDQSESSLLQIEFISQTNKT